ERFADSQIPLAPRAPSIHDPEETSRWKGGFKLLSLSREALVCSCQWFCYLPGAIEKQVCYGAQTSPPQSCDSDRSKFFRQRDGQCLNGYAFCSNLQHPARNDGNEASV